MNHQRNVFHVIFFLFALVGAHINFLNTIYTRTMPLNNIHDKSYTLHFGNILYSFVILISILIMRFQDYSKKDWIIAIVLGVISLGITTPIMITGIISSTCVVVTYLASKSLYGKYSTRMELFNAKSFKDFLIDLKWILIVSGFFIGVRLVSISFLGMSIQFAFHPSMLARALGAAVSEEIIYRLFLFSVIVDIGKGEVESNVLAVLVMIIPFGLFHFVEVGIFQGVLSAFIMSLNFLAFSIAETILALKRNVFSSMIVHFLIDIVGFSLIS